MLDELKKCMLIAVFLMGFLTYAQNEDYKVWEEKINQGYQFFQQNNFKDAKTQLEEALKVSGRVSDSLPTADILTKYYYGATLYKLNSFIKANSYFNQSLQLAENLKERDLDFEIVLKTEIAGVYSTIGDVNTAIKKQNELLGFIKKYKDVKTELYAANLNNLGQLYFALGDCNEASKHYNLAKDIFVELQTKTINVATVYNNLGLCLFSAGKYIEADNTYYESLLIVEELKQEGTYFYSKLLSNIAALSHVQGDYTNAQLLHENSLTILSNLNLSDTIEYAEGLFVYGQLLKDLGKFDDALKKIINAKKIYDKYLEQDHLKFADLNSVLAEINLNNGNTKDALKLYEQASQLFKEKAPDTNPGYGYALNGLGNTYQVLGDYPKALEFYLKGLEHLKLSLSETHKDYGITLMNIGKVNADLGNYTEAFSYYDKAIDVIGDSIGTQNTVYGQLCLGLLDVIFRIPELDITEFDYLIDTTLSIFEVNSEGNNLFYNSALFYKAVLNIKNKDYKNALDLLLKVEKEIAKDIDKDSKLYNNIIAYIAFNYHYLEDYDNAFLYYKKRNDHLISSVSEVFSFRSEKDKRTYLKQIEYWFSDLTSISLDENFSNQEITTLALNNQLLRKGLLLNSSKDIATQLATLQNPEIDAKIQEYKSLKDLIIYMELLPEIQSLEELENVKADLNRFETELVELYNANFDTDLTFKKDWRTIKSALKDNEVAIEFVAYVKSQKNTNIQDTKYIAYVIKNTSKYPEVVELFSESEIKNILSKKSPNQLYATRGSKSKSITVSKDMYNVIWKPLEEHVNDIETIYYSPVGLLNQIPFAALNTEGEDLLNVKHNLVQLSSTGLLNETFSEPISNNTMFIGGIDYEFIPTGKEKSNTQQELDFLRTTKGIRSLGTTWEYLPGTLSEVKALQNLFQQNNKTYSSLTQKAATEEEFNKLGGKSPSVLHIATHGFFFENLPQEEKNELEWSAELVYKASEDPLMRSGLILAGANYAWEKGSNPYKDENGILTALEISNLDLSNTDMVVLSACKTGLGDIDGSEGVYGLQRAFKMAGVDIIVMSLWEVPDKETAEFMNLFYSNWLDGMKVREAFNTTQRTMSNTYKESPEKWAAFVLFE